jgi:methionyl-tRNA synthetase
MAKNKFYVTTAIMYVNSKPHLGYALEAILGDVLARHHRALGDDTFYLTGTDEHGVKMQKTAEEAGITPQELADQNTKLTQDLVRDLGVDVDGFVRTTDEKNHWPAVIRIWQKIAENGDLEKRKYQALYCVGCEAFLSPSELVDGKCPIHGKEPEEVEEENWFFKLSKYQDILKKKIKDDEIRVIPEKRKNEILAFIDRDLDDVSFSRDKDKLSWGIPVPGDETQTMYVWCDALTNYISALGYANETEDFKKYWPADVHIIGKDILRFHALYWPAMLISAGLDTPQTIMVHGFINSGGKKMSKSTGNVIDPKFIIEKYGAETLRYYLLRYIPTLDDGDFTPEHFEGVYRADLSNDLGNLVQRTLAMIDQNKVKIVKRDNLECTTENCIGQYIESFEFDKALEKLWVCISNQNRFIDNEKPWELAKAGNEIKLTEVLQKIYDFLVIFSEQIAPFMPETSEKMKEQLQTLKPKPLFPRIEPSPASLGETERGEYDGNNQKGAGE